jgi:hypothetical protein
MLEASSGPTGNRLVPVWLAIGILFALLVAAGTCILAWLNGDKVPAAILKAGGAFAATVTLVILLLGLIAT